MLEIDQIVHPSIVVSEWVLYSIQ